MLLIKNKYLTMHSIQLLVNYLVTSSNQFYNLPKVLMMPIILVIKEVNQQFLINIKWLTVILLN